MNKEMFLNVDQAKENLHKAIKQQDKIELRTSRNPIFSIIALTYNKAYWTLPFLKSLEKTDLSKSEVIIIDNNSKDETGSLLDLVSGAQVIKNDKNIFYAGGCNQGASIAKGEYLVFLNNDLILKDDFIENLYEIFKKFRKVGSVGGKLCHVDGRLQEAGNIIWQDGTPLSYGRNDIAEKYEYNFVRQVAYCSAAILMMKKELFTALGGFDNHYEPAYFEDTDLAMKISEQGLRCYYTPFATGIHIEHGSSNLEDVVSLMSKNQRKFFLRWKDVLQKNHPPRKQDILNSRESLGRKKILFIDHRVPVVENGAGYPRAFDMIETLTQQDYQICLFPLKKDEVDTSGWSATTEKLRRMGVEVVDGDIRFQDFCRSRTSYFDVILVSRYAALDKIFLDLKSLLPNIPIIFDSEAVDFLRLEQKHQYLGTPSLESIELSKRKEMSYINMVDHVLFVSANDRDKISKINPVITSKSHILGFSLNPTPGASDFEQRSDFLFLGGFLGNTGLNEHAIQYFSSQVWPNLHKNIPSALLKIAGSHMPQEIKDLKSDSIEILGFVKELDDLMDKTRIFVVPHLFAGGIPLKLSIAMSKGVPSVVSRIIAEQMGLKEGKGVLICNNSQEFVDKSTKLYSDKKLWLQLREEALNFIETTHNPKAWKLNLIEAIRMFADK